ncbi:MAG: type IV pilus twitching motility protein PilT [Planctomycetes bacterium]|nr:type IV pilus twitching motility protein PilT [Planctomycetota bacterium]
MDMDKLLEATVKHNGSDLHLRVGAPPKLRISGKLRSMGEEVLTPEMTNSLMKSITSEKHQQELAEVGGADYGLSFRDVARFRVSVFKHQGNIGLVLRQIPNRLFTFEQIGLPEVVKELCHRPRGLFLVTGPTGSGKTTTLAGMIDFINQGRSDHIITIEDPIEYVHPHKKCVVTQREIGSNNDVPSFSEALRRALRQDPDIILVGEMRDLETIGAAISAAETGHLVFGTLHTTGASKTINRIIDAFPTDQQEMVRTQLSVGLIAVLSQQLMATTDGKGRVAAYELMISIPAISALIRENQTFKIDSVLQTSGRLGMMLLDDHLFNLFTIGKIKEEDMMQRCVYKDQLINKVNIWRAEQQRLAAQKKR